MNTFWVERKQFCRKITARRRGLRRTFFGISQTQTASTGDGERRGKGGSWKEREDKSEGGGAREEIGGQRQRVCETGRAEDERPAAGIKGSVRQLERDRRPLPLAKYCARILIYQVRCKSIQQGNCDKSAHGASGGLHKMRETATSRGAFASKKYAVTGTGDACKTHRQWRLLHVIS